MLECRGNVIDQNAQFLERDDAVLLSDVVHLLIESNFKVLILKRNLIEIVFLLDMKGMQLTLIVRQIHMFGCLSWHRLMSDSSMFCLITPCFSISFTIFAFLEPLC